jgi:hypothetical protein
MQGVVGAAGAVLFEFQPFGGLILAFRGGVVPLGTLTASQNHLFQFFLFGTHCQKPAFRL